MTILDRHTAHLKQLTNAVGQLTTIALQQSDNISFLLREHVVIKADVAILKMDVGTLRDDVGALKSDVGTLKDEVGALKGDVGTLKGDVGALRADVGALKADVAEVKSSQQVMDGKLDLILTKLQ